MSDVPLMFDHDQAVNWFLDLPRYPTRDEVHTASVRLGRNSFPALVADLWANGALRIDEDFSHLVAAAWEMAEFPLRQLDEYTWRDLFSDAGFTIDGKHAPTLSQQDVPTLYRGAAPDSRAGWSWTPDRDLAEWFRDRFDYDKTRRLYVLAPPAAAVLAVFTSDGSEGEFRGESEWVIDTAGLDPVEETMTAKGGESA